MPRTGEQGIRDPFRHTKEEKKDRYDRLYPHPGERDESDSGMNGISQISMQ